MSNVIYPVSLIAHYRKKADEWRRQASLMSKSDLKRRLVQVAENYDTLAGKIERVAGRRWLSKAVGKAIR